MTARPWSRPWPAFLGQELQSLGVRCVAFEDRALSVADHAGILGAAGEIRLVPVDNAFHALRAVKSDQELATIAEAARITDAAFVAATSDLEPGITEKALAWRIESAMHELGADGPGFPVIVAAGPHGARPHHDPSDRPIEEGEPVVIDMGAMVGGYTADLTRTICLGQAPPIVHRQIQYRAERSTTCTHADPRRNVRPGGGRGRQGSAVRRRLRRPVRAWAWAWRRFEHS